ncbi:MAG: YCF48-related protein [Bacteroidales bacterium]|nr:YCF48-related protein [Bacteroidales bacterium]
MYCNFSLSLRTLLGRSGILLLMLCFLIASADATAKKKKDKNEAADTLKSSVFSGLKWRSIGPAFTSGRIADFAVNPDNHSEYYVAVASGHLWKTTNNGTTFSPIFDNHKAYSMGVVAMAPSNHNLIWLGTGENNHQRALGYGNGVYKSADGGSSWEHMGLDSSRQIGKIVIHPANPNIVFVAAEGSVWGSGGQRGLYKTTDGGKNWKKVLEISENTGVNDIVMDPRNPDVLYATSEQRRRHVYTKIGGGPESAVYKSTDGGETWNKIMKGLPGVHIGGMGMAISPANPDYLYLIMEAQDDKGGFFRTTNGGASWEKRGSYHSSGQYYNEIVADPNDPEKVYSLETYSKVSTDGGKTWRSVGNKGRHVDDHAMWIDPNDSEHFMIGGDGGIYETYDGGSNFLFKSNLPVTQFYRVTLDDSEPFYWVYGGTQDNNSMGGPSRNTKSQGVTSDEWIVTLGGDGFFQAIEPGNPDVVYSAYQYGNIFRYDKKSGQRIDIKPEPGKDELTYRWNWNTPFFLSPHSGTRLYIAANKVFRSDDRGNSWQVISDDLTRDQDRNQFKVMGKYWPSNAVAKDISTSLWGTIVSLAESPVKEDLLYVGTDDGVIQVTEDAGKNWRKTTSFPGVPEFTYVSDIMPSRFDENVVYASFDNIKSDDFKPYLLRSNDKGATWTSIAGNLPEDETIHTIQQDYKVPELLFVGTEFSVFFTIDGGITWTQLASGIPDVAVKDIAIQERESDLVAATFGRGFYVLDDYSALRQINKDTLENQAKLFPVKDALLYIQEGGRYGQGSTYFSAGNPDFGATFTYYIKEVPETTKQKRLKEEKKLFKESKPIPQPSIEQLREEERELPPVMVFTIKDQQGKTIRNLYKSPAKGINRLTWDLRYQGKYPVNLRDKKFDPKKGGNPGMLVMPGKYTVELTLDQDGEITPLAGPVNFTVKLLDNITLPNDDVAGLAAYQDNVAELGRTLRGAENYLGDLIDKTESIRQALHNTPGIPKELSTESRDIANKLDDLKVRFSGIQTGASSEETPPTEVSLNQRYGVIGWSHYASTSAPTKTHLTQYEILMEEVPGVVDEIKALNNRIEILEQKMEQYEVPPTPGRIPGLKK